MQPQILNSPEAALADLPVGATVMVGGQNGLGLPEGLLEALGNRGASELTLVCEADSSAVLGLVFSGCVRKLQCPRPTEHVWRDLEATGVQVELLPSGTLAERIRAAGAGIGAVLLSPHAAESLDTGKDFQQLDGQHYVVETPLRADFALLRAHKADTLGNLIYQGAARNWNPIMATAATIVTVEVDEVVEPGELDPEVVITPGIFVDRIVWPQIPMA